MLSKGDLEVSLTIRKVIDEISSTQKIDLEMIVIKKNRGTLKEVFTGPTLKKSTLVIPPTPQ
jgi:hypothetical protein